MRKRKASTTSMLSRETPDTPSPEKVPSRKVRILPSPPTTRMLRRKGTPTCSNYGSNRQLLYPEYFFCHNCEEWDTCSTLGIKKYKCRPASLPCTAKHSSFVFPSTKLEKFRGETLHHTSCSTKRKKMTYSSVSPCNLNIDQDAVSPLVDSSPVAQVESSPSDRIHAVTLESCLAQLTQKEKEITELTRKLENSKKLANVYKAKADRSAGTELPHPTDVQLELDEAVVKAIKEIIASDRRFSRYGNARKGRLIAKAVLHKDLVNMSFSYCSCKEVVEKKCIYPLENVEGDGFGWWLL